MKKASIDIKSGRYDLIINEAKKVKDAKVSVVMVTALKSELAVLALKTFKKFNNIPTNYYLVDNYSSETIKAKLLNELSDVTTIFNIHRPQDSPTDAWGSNLNAIGIDIGCHFSDTPYTFVCHNDVVALNENWLKYLYDKCNNEGYSAASFFMDTERISAMHICGYLFDNNVYTRQNQDWYPQKVNDQWIYDVGDHLTKFIREKNKKYFIARNTHNGTASRSDNIVTLLDKLDYPVSVAVDDNNRPLYAHLGRGTLKSANLYNKSHKTSCKNWVDVLTGLHS